MSHNYEVTTSDTRSVASVVRSALGRGIFAPATTRLLWVPVHLLVFSLGVMVTRWWATQGHSPFVLLPLSLVIGMSYAGLAFVAHETLHGALSRRRWVRRIIGFIGFAPFCVSPRLWIAWHNRVHHGNTNISGRDPDAYPDITEYQNSRTARLAVKWAAPRSRKWRGWITLALGFSLQSLQVLASARKRRYLSRSSYVLAWLETLLAAGFWALLLAWVGLQVFVVVYLVPLMVGNAIVMAHIVTNHSLSPLCEKNDALASGLSVSVPKWFEIYTLGFGYHVEHHLFPAMSNRHAPKVQAELRRIAPERYQEMPLTRALALLFTTPRVYGSNDTLVDPDTGETFSTLGRGEPDDQFRSDESSAVRPVLPPSIPEREQRNSTAPPPAVA